MHVIVRLPPFTAAMLLFAAAGAGAQSSLPDPVAPAVLGRPLDQIRSARALRDQAVAAKPAARKAVAARARAEPVRTRVPVALAPAAPAPSAPAAASRVAQMQPLQQPAAPDTRVSGNIGSPSQAAGRLLAPGAYFSSNDHALVRRYYAAHPAADALAPWKVGQALPARAELTGVPDDLRGALSPLPRGHQYVQVNGEVVVVALPSRVVMDGVSRSAR